MARRWKILIGVVASLLVILLLNALALDRQTKDAHHTVESSTLIDTIGGQIQTTDSGARDKSPIVLIHCYTCSLQWWDGILPLLEHNHRVIRVDLLGHGGSEKPTSGYSIDDQASAVSAVLGQLGVQHATVVGHSLGFAVATALAERTPDLVSRLVDIDEAPDGSYGDLPFTAKLVGTPLIGQAAYRLTPDFQARKDLKVAFAPHYNLASGFENPDQPVDDFREMTYDSFTKAADAADSFTKDEPLDERIAGLASPVPLLVIFGTEDQLYDPPEKAADAFTDVPGAQIAMIDGAGHSPNVERPMQTAEKILDFAATPGDELLPSTPEFVPPPKQTEPPAGNKKHHKKHRRHKKHRGN
jgi:pimeloyl-ACP methyl ester carboxylesterase